MSDCWGIFCFVFLIATLYAAVKRPPMTARGRLFYALLGAFGLILGGLALWGSAEAAGLWGPKAAAKPAPTTSEIFQAMFGRQPDLSLNLLAGTMYLAGVVFFVAAAAWPGHRDEEPVGD